MAETGKFDFQKIISDVKSMINPIVIPEASKDDPIGYCLSELSKQVKELADMQGKQAESLAKVNTILGTLHQEVTKKLGASAAPAVAPAAPDAAKPAATEESAPAAPAEEKK